jgi:aminoglycoside phosphotransferase (APT) family kinase protein
MHADEVETDVSLVRRLLATQFPQWADLRIEPVASAGTDNAIYRLGDDMAVRLPRIAWATGQAEKEQRWLPRLAPHLPLAIPVPLAMGTPAEGYAWHWSVVPWLEGENATIDRIADLRRAAIDLAQFVAALRRIDPTGGPAAGRHNFFRGVPLAMIDAYTRDAIATRSARRCRSMTRPGRAARGWALYPAVRALPYYLHANPVIVANARHAIDAVLADHKSGA